MIEVSSMASEKEKDPLNILGEVVRKYSREIGKGFLSKINDTDITIKNFTIDRKAKIRIYKCIVNFCHNLTIVIPNDLKQSLDDIIKKSSLRVEV